MSKAYMQIYVRKNLVPCPCCTGPVADARPEEWYYDRKLVRPVLAPEGSKYKKGTKIWQCVICKNRREVTPAKAMTFILLNL